jgi:hypothetical protein
MDPRYKSPTAEVVDKNAPEGFRDLTTFTTVLTWMLRFGAVLAIVCLWSCWLQLELLSRVFTPEEGAANDQRMAMVAGAEVLLKLITFFVFGRWIVLAHRNLDALGAQYLEFRPGWAVGWFFIPIANLWKPYQAMRSLWRSSHSVHRPDIQDNTWVLPTWWTLWLVSSFLGNISWRMERNATTTQEFVTLTAVNMVEFLLEAVLCIVASILVTRIWQAQDKQRENPEEFEPEKGFADGPR